MSPFYGPRQELPKYRSHKIVQAVKIKRIYANPQGFTVIEPEEEGIEPFIVDSQYVTKHDPQAGGFFVVYDDGYKSWSPAKAFEEGYSLVTAKSMSNTDSQVGAK